MIKQLATTRITQCNNQNKNICKTRKAAIVTTQNINIQQQNKKYI